MMSAILKVSRWEFLQNIRSRRFLTTTVLIPLIIFGFSSIAIWLASSESAQSSGQHLFDRQQLEQLEKLLQKTQGATPEELSQRAQAQQVITMLISSVFAFIFIYSSLFSVVMVLMGVVREKQSRVVELLLSSISPAELMYGKILGFAGLGLVQVLIWIAIGLGLFVLFGPSLGLPAPLLVGIVVAYMPWTILALYVLFFVLGYLFIAALSAAMGATMGVEDILSGQQLQSTLIIMPMILPAMFLQRIIDDPNGMFTLVLSFIPFTAPTTMLIRLAKSPEVPVAVWQTALSLIVLALCCWLAMRLAAKIFSVGILLYGKSASLGEMWTWLRR
ncbi:ABC transporter permease [Candidatus Acetothermia bacterium]|nr:ABC transporter permease [Candidatus Acetothermia bacterium]MBI3460188.1 ABC transporter permease [Candidatus Acetothermia bacterium]